jgi:hypothetical protein
MADCTININPLYNNYFSIRFDRGTKQFELMCQKANLPGISSPDITQPTTLGTTVPVPSLVAAFEPLEVSFVVDSNLTNWKSLYSWIRNITNIKDATSNNLDYEDWHVDATMMVYNSPFKPQGCNTPLLTIRYINVVPVSLSGLVFQSDVADGTLQKASCKFNYSYYTIRPDAPSNLS